MEVNQRNNINFFHFIINSGISELLVKNNTKVVQLVTYLSTQTVILYSNVLL